MPVYQVEVTEVRHVRCLYTIEADDQDEAMELARIGDTVDEEELKDDGVYHREVHHDTVEEVTDPPHEETPP